MNELNCMLLISATEYPSLGRFQWTGYSHAPRIWHWDWRAVNFSLEGVSSSLYSRKEPLELWQHIFFLPSGGYLLCLSFISFQQRYFIWSWFSVYVEHRKVGSLRLFKIIFKMIFRFITWQNFLLYCKTNFLFSWGGSRSPLGKAGWRPLQKRFK